MHDMIDRTNFLASRRAVLSGLAASAAVVGLGGCTRMLGGVAELTTDVTVHEDLAYGPHKRHRLDLYIPDKASADTPVVLFLYGGSWKWGSRGRYAFVGYGLASRGFAVAVADYRLYPEVRFPEFNDDAARAAAWLQSERSGFGLAPGPLNLMGHSAGAHIAALIALDPRYLERRDLTPADLGRVVGLSGPYGMYPSRIDFVADIFPPAAEEAMARPVTFARGEAPPMLLLHGADDSLVSPKNSETLANLLTIEGAAAEARVYPDVGHREMVLALSPLFSGLAPVLDDASAFLKSGPAAQRPDQERRAQAVRYLAANTPDSFRRDLDPTLTFMRLGY